MSSDGVYKLCIWCSPVLRSKNKIRKDDAEFLRRLCNVCTCSLSKYDVRVMGSKRSMVKQAFEKTEREFNINWSHDIIILFYTGTFFRNGNRTAASRLVFIEHPRLALWNWLWLSTKLRAYRKTAIDSARIRENPRSSSIPWRSKFFPRVRRSTLFCTLSNATSSLPRYWARSRTHRRN